MTHPTDDELEEMAARLDDIARFLNTAVTKVGSTTFAEAAAMLRACKGGSVKVKALIWDNFDGMGARASSFGRMSYLISKRSDGRFEVCESYPGTHGGYIGDGFYPTLKAAKAAAQADYERRILSALEPAPPRGKRGE